MKKVKFSQILDFQKKSHIKAGDGLSEGSFPFFTSSPVLSKYINISQFDSPSLIFGTGGSASIHICEKHFSVSTDCLVAQLKPMATKQFEIKFIYYYLSGNISILENGFKGAGLRHISKGYINNIDIPEISLEDQKRIVKILDRADDLRQKRKQAIGLLDEYLKSVFLEMFGDPVKNEKEWKIKKIDDIVSDQKYAIRMGPFGSQLKKHELVDEGIKVIWIEDIVKNKFNWLEKKGKCITSEKYSQLVGFGTKEGDVLITNMGTIGRTAVVPKNFGKAIISSHLLKITPNTNIVNSTFLSEYIKSDFARNYFDKVAHGQIMKGLNTTKIKDLPIIMPDIKLQEKFSVVFEKITEIKQKMTAQSNKLETQFQALMQKAFRGGL